MRYRVPVLVLITLCPMVLAPPVLASQVATEGQVRGQSTLNGSTTELLHGLGARVPGTTGSNVFDVLVVASDKPLPADLDTRDSDALSLLSREGQRVIVVVWLRARAPAGSEGVQDDDVTDREVAARLYDPSIDHPLDASGSLLSLTDETLVVSRRVILVNRGVLSGPVRTRGVAQIGAHRWSLNLEIAGLALRTEAAQ